MPTPAGDRTRIDMARPGYINLPDPTQPVKLPKALTATPHPAPMPVPAAPPPSARRIPAAARRLWQRPATTEEMRLAKVRRREARRRHRIEIYREVREVMWMFFAVACLLVILGSSLVAWLAFAGKIVWADGTPIH